MLFILSAAGFAATMFLFFYAGQLTKHDIQPDWMRRETPSMLLALGFTIAIAMTLTGMFASAAPSNVVLDILVASGATAAILLVAIYSARFYGKRAARRPRAGV